MAEPVPIAQVLSSSGSRNTNARIPSIDTQAINSMRGLQVGQLPNPAVFSPINVNGSYEFDKVLKSGSLQKRTRKTKNWKPVYVVLRPNRISMYKNAEETKLRHQVEIADITAVATRRDPKQKRLYVFSLFTPSKNYHFQARSEQDLREWVDILQHVARVEEEEVDLHSAQPGYNIDDRLASSSPEPTEQPISKVALMDTANSANLPPPARRFSVLDYSGGELSAASDMSDNGGAPKRKFSTGNGIHALGTGTRPDMNRNKSQLSTLNTIEDEERVIWHGYLLRLKSNKGVRQWKKSWMVLRPKNMVLYKNEEEYRADLVVPMDGVLNVVEIDPISKSKKHCLQVICEEKTYRFAAKNEEVLARCLGSFKSILARKEAHGHNLSGVSAATGNTAGAIPVINPNGASAGIPIPSQAPAHAQSLSMSPPSLSPISLSTATQAQRA